MKIDSIRGKQDIVWSEGLTAKDVADAMRDILGYEGYLCLWENEARRLVGDIVSPYDVIDKGMHYVFCGSAALVDG